MAHTSLGEKIRATLVAAITAPFKYMLEVFFGLLERFVEAIASRIDRDMQVGSLPAETFMYRDIGKSTSMRVFWAESKKMGLLSRIFFAPIFALLYASNSISVLMRALEPIARRDVYEEYHINYPSFREMIPAKFRDELTEKDLKTLATFWGFSPGWYDLIEKSVKPLLDPRDLQALIFRGELNSAEVKKRLTHHGFTESEAELITKSWPRPPEFSFLRDMKLRGLIDEAGTTKALKAAGYPEEYAKKLQELFFYIPSPPDLVRMAVREAFTPEIAERFGQYQDFPPDFAKWAAKQGMSDFWARAYWAAHWDLPSVSDGFEMVHRGVITRPDLELLLRAKDIMPFWREKLLKISYRPFTRVDVRRMHALGVLTAAEVKKSYMDIGYDDEKAEKMARFTIALNTEKERDLTKADILDGFQRRLIDEAEAEDMLESLGYDELEVTFFLQRAKLKALEAKKKQLVANVKSRFEKGVIDEAEAITRLLTAGLVQAEIDEYIATWSETRGEQVHTPTVGDLRAFLKAGIIDETIFTNEMVAKGCSQRYISWYVQATKTK